MVTYVDLEWAVCMGRLQNQPHPLVHWPNHNNLTSQRKRTSALVQLRRVLVMGKYDQELIIYIEESILLPYTPVETCKVMT